jgi:thermostable 8-oxoguanine DNA glycosylase
MPTLKIVWKINRRDVTSVKDFFADRRKSLLVITRTRDNIDKRPKRISRDKVWERMIGCLLTTQQRSGPDSSVARFIRSKPFPLSYTICNQKRDVSGYSRQVLRNYGGLRYFNNVSQYLTANKEFLEEDGWEPTLEQINQVRLNPCTTIERTAAEFISDNFMGFGPKQSRNLLQWLGVSQYEIPIDSRITKWLNEFGFPVELSASALQDRGYYNFVSDGFQQLSAACGILPCILDAAIFSSFDED